MELEGAKPKTSREIEPELTKGIIENTMEKVDPSSFLRRIIMEIILCP
jgi:hypothetical protein